MTKQISPIIGTSIPVEETKNYIIEQIYNTTRFKILYQSNFLRQITASLSKQRNIIKEDPF